MRIASKNLYDNIRNSLARTSTEMLRANQVVSSGKRINRLSDDPVGMVTVLDLRSSLSHIEQLERNITMGKSWLDMGESALTQIEDLLSETRALCVSMANETKGSTERANAAAEVDGTLRQILSLANTQVGGRYIFAGTKTDTSPFAFDVEAAPTTVDYAGNDTAFSVNIGKDLNVAVGRDGEEVFGASGSSVFDTLIDLKAHLLANEPDEIAGVLEALDGHMENVRALVSNTGVRSLRLETKGNIIQDLELTYAERKSQMEDADVAEAIIDLEEAELAYRAALSSSSKVMSLSLVDFL